ncbi:protein kinase domain containing protein [Nitzschia inconspicua]|uniref:Protein kinase domain containing protein n=1 Tax=Nitzschia inconspicua TaxID=303405 RepID=A0A9K3KJL7_9STRA|nr:protein kinase domain containing protein [Nitzschia inconspicua]
MTDRSSSTVSKPVLDPTLETPAPKLYGEVTVTQHEWGTSVWEDYDQLEMLADSGTGEIWLCQKKTDKRTVEEEEEDNVISNETDARQKQLYVIKTIDKNFLSGMFAKELRNEVDILRQLDHPHIVRIYGVYEDPDSIYLVMEYCPGGDLTTRFPYSEAQVARIMTQVLSAVVCCHQHKVVHRDLKLENITWATENTVKLLDFGYAQKYRRPRGDYTMKMDVGTTYTLSPQVIEGEYSERTDEWGVGVMAYMLLTGGTKPFDADKNVRLRDEIRKGKYSMDGQEWENVSQQAKDFVSSLLEYKEEKRITAEEALESPWLKFQDNNQEELNESVIDSVAEALITTVQEPKLKRLSMLILAHEVAESEIEHLRKAFAAMDSTKDGTIRLQEFQSIIQNSKTLNIGTDELTEVFQELDLNDTGAICYTDFLSATLESIAKIDKNMVAEAFDRLDVESDGVIDKEDLQAVLAIDSDREAAQDRAEEILSEVDTNHSGKIGFETFASMFFDDVPKYD